MFQNIARDGVALDAQSCLSLGCHYTDTWEGLLSNSVVYLLLGLHSSGY